MADVDVIHTVTETKKTRKVKKSTTSKRRESSDQGSEITITEIEQTANENEKGYVRWCDRGLNCGPSEHIVIVDSVRLIEILED